MGEFYINTYRNWFSFFKYLHRFNDDFCTFRHSSVNCGVTLHCCRQFQENIFPGKLQNLTFIYIADNCYSHYLSGTSLTMLRMGYSYGCCTGLTPLETTRPGHYRRMHCWQTSSSLKYWFSPTLSYATWSPSQWETEKNPTLWTLDL